MRWVPEENLRSIGFRNGASQIPVGALPGSVEKGAQNGDEDTEQPSEGEVALEDETSELDEPVRYAVVLHNDDYTTMEFVVLVLRKFFKKTLEDATAVMLRVHHEGRGVAGIYSFEVAETKVAQVMEYSKENGFPLRCTCEPIGRDGS